MKFFIKLKPGLSSFAKNPALAVENVVKLVKEARRVVPKNLWLHTPITLKATAGLRLLPGVEAEAIMSYVSFSFLCVILGTGKRIMRVRLYKRIHNVRC